MRKGIDKYPKMLSDDGALLSIKPNYARAILSGDKKFEFRRSRIKKDIDFILIYASSPMKAFVGFAEVEDIITDTPTKLWKIAGDHGGISHKDFMEYFKGKANGYALKLKAIHKFEISISPDDIFDGFRPPQSFMYLSNMFLDKIYETVGAND